MHGGSAPCGTVAGGNGGDGAGAKKRTRMKSRSGIGTVIRCEPIVLRANLSIAFHSCFVILLRLIYILSHPLDLAGKAWRHHPTPSRLRPQADLGTPQCV